ncbi:MAG: ABC transporter substrate-binding protein [Geminicoccaceae bacterium]|nr:ABC transporter substrate-binding protein [Geminicoccaceae bacterium]
MKRTSVGLTRRSMLVTGTMGLAAASMPRLALAQDGPIKVGSLTPLTGVGGTYGPSMRDAIAGVIASVNEAGGVIGREVELVSEDTQTNPEAAVRAARKLIDLDGVSAIMGTWASSVTTAVAPVCWESGVMLFTVSGSDSITLLPHQGYIIRTQPNSHLQISVAADFMVAQGGTKFGWVGPQTPFAAESIAVTRETGEKNGIETIELIYEADKTSYRSEVDRVLAESPDFILLGGYVADSTVLLRDLYQAGYDGRIIGPAYAVNQSLIDALPPEVIEGVFTWEGTPDIESGAYARVKAILGVDTVDPYSAQTYDHASLCMLAIQSAGSAKGPDIRDNVRKISQGDGETVDNAVDGISILAGGGSVNYSGASGPCDFTDIGDITKTNFLFKRIEGGKAVDFERI